MFGKYRGMVVGNVDPLNLGRLLVRVPQVLIGETAWALPCVPYAGPQVGFCFTPPIGGNVWVEFEGGDIGLPIWVGCFWGASERPVAALGPEVKLIQTETAVVSMNDSPMEGGITINVQDAAVDVPAGITINSAGIEITVEPAMVTMSPERGIAVAFPPNVLVLSDESIAPRWRGRDD